MAIENIEEIEGALGLEKGKLSEMITSEDAHSVDLSTRVFYAKEDDEARLSNIKKDAASASIEVAIKNARAEHGLEFQGKTMENLLAAFGAKKELESKIEPEEKYKTLKSDFEKLQTNFANQGTEFETFKSTVTQKESENKMNGEIKKSIPSNDKLNISQDQALVLFKNQFTVGTDDQGRTVVSDQSGQVMKNTTTLDPLSLGEIMQTFIKPFAKEATGGAGGSDETGVAKAGSFEAFQAEMEKKNIGGEALNIELNKRIKDGTLKM
jgi:hypothetical protein